MIRSFKLESDVMSRLIEFCNDKATKIKDDEKWQVFSIASLFQNNITGFLFYRCSCEKSLMVLLHTTYVEKVKGIIDHCGAEDAIQQIEQLEKNAFI